MLNRPSDRRFASEDCDLTPGPPGAENDTLDVVAHKDSKGKKEKDMSKRSSSPPSSRGRSGRADRTPSSRGRPSPSPRQRRSPSPGLRRRRSTSRGRRSRSRDNYNYRRFGRMRKDHHQCEGIEII